ncbi:Down syndrome cell adhesion molecule-like isoform X2 [Tetranychus urticae]|uniref:Down syndrome cell adhesion molecule-like isoform X2 n=1 Tax=Tetranychus urticae TaxID=32264 RepID=UPI000D6585A0|nr:Down syndrome cell adhesion molecule-like isoform X2 [Tetranychus urticae]
MDFITFFVLIVDLFTTIYAQTSPRVAPISPLVKPVIGGKTSLACQNIEGTPPIQLNWFKDGKELSNSQSIKIRTIEDSSMLILDPISTSHSGNYTCKVSNNFGSDSYSTELLIEGPPFWITKPRHIKAKIGQTIELDCIASGFPKPEIVWKKFTDDMWTNINYLQNVQISNDHLIINSIDRLHAGSYGCSASNKIEPNLWTEFVIMVEVDITFI